MHQKKIYKKKEMQSELFERSQEQFDTDKTVNSSHENIDWLFDYTREIEKEISQQINQENEKELEIGDEDWLLEFYRKTEK